ncbi:nadph:quinone oxidoreductase [Lasius niger]|uniref:Enoyl-[acyl-carrier-protein] reductase, mitochondrial n=1 Tax=Lasius niger TaxID=67767 RepID=A0A0J7KVR4_LASNI|nr:nadph:quinone oxidoreductase [Lasius niger]
MLKREGATYKYKKNWHPFLVEDLTDEGGHLITGQNPASASSVGDRLAEILMEDDPLSISEFGNPEEVVSYKECPLPEPKAGEVRVRMLLAPIHNHHLWYIKGRYGIKPTLPAVSGDEAIGLIEKIGPEVKGLHVAQKVVACKMWGTWAEAFIAKATDVVPIPKGVPDEVAAQIFSMPLSTMMLLGMAGAKEGDWIIQNAANGAVGKMLAGIAATRRIHVVSLVRSEQAKSEMTMLGIKNVVITSDPDWKEQDGGTLVAFGAQTQQPIMLDPADVIFRNKKVRGFWATRSAKEIPPKVKLKMLFNVIKAVLLGKLTLSEAGGFNLERLSKALALKNLAGLLRAGKIHLPVAGVFPLSEYKAALALAEKSGRNGIVAFSALSPALALASQKEDSLKTEDVSQNLPLKDKKILFVLSSKAKLEGQSPRPAGLWAQSLAAPYEILTKQDFATPYTKEFKKDPKAQALLAHTSRLSEVKATDYDAICYTSSYGMFYDLIDNADSIRLLTAFERAKKPIGLTSQGPLVLKNVTDTQGNPVVKVVVLKTMDHGRTYRTAELPEDQFLKKLKLVGTVPFLSETLVKSQGAEYKSRKNWEPLVVEDLTNEGGLLLTAQNPDSVELWSKALIQILLDKKSVETKIAKKGAIELSDDGQELAV